MFTQCPQCDSTFRVNAAQLQQAGGKVRCGRCSNVFNALEKLEEQLPDEVEPNWLQQAVAPETADEPLETALEEAIEEALEAPDEAGGHVRQEPVFTNPQDPIEEPPEFLETNVFEEVLIQNLDGLADEVAETTGEFTDEELLSSEALLVVDDYTFAADEQNDTEEQRTETEILLYDDSGSFTYEELHGRKYPGDESDEPIEASDGFEDDEDWVPEGLYAIEEDDEPDRDANDTAGEQNTAPKAGAEIEDLEFNVPKNQWGSFFSGRYDGPIIDPVGPLDGGNAEPTPIDIGDADGEPDDEGDDNWEDLDEVLASDTPDHFDENIDQDDALADTDVSEDVVLQTTSDSPDDTLRTVIDTLTMHQSEWQRLLDDSDADDQSDEDDGPAYAVESDNADDDSRISSIEADTVVDEAAAVPVDETPEDSAAPFEAHDFDGQEDAETDQHDVADDTNSHAYDGDGDHYDAADEIDDSNESVAATEADNVAAQKVTPVTERAEDVTPIWVSNHDEESEKTSKTKGLVAVVLLVLALGLGAQLIHHNRETLATHPQYGEQIRTLYDIINRPLFPAWNLDAYEFRGSEAISGESGAGILDIRAQLAVTGKQAMGEPLIKIVLKDRWGKEVSSRVFTPDQYSKGMRPPNGLINPGALIPVAISIADPGSDAQGFELMICLPHESGVPKCKS